MINEYRLVCFCETAGIGPHWPREECPDTKAEAPVDHDPVNSPSHYTSHPSGIECIQLAEHQGFCLGNATKYLFRRDHKGNPLEQLRKASWYVAKEIERRTSESWGVFPDDPRYEISSAGRVRWAATGRVRTTVPIKNGYMTFMTNVDKRAVLHYVHRAVVKTFFGDIPAGMYVCHNDGDRSNNHITNLRVDTVRGNARDRRLHGTHCVGGQNYAAKLDVEAVHDIRSRADESEEALAAEFGVTRATIGRVRRGESWTDPRLAQEIAFDTWAEHEPPGPIREAISLIWRAGHAPHSVDLLERAAQYIDFEIERREQQAAGSERDGAAS